MTTRDLKVTLSMALADIEANIRVHEAEVAKYREAANTLRGLMNAPVRRDLTPPPPPAAHTEGAQRRWDRQGPSKRAQVLGVALELIDASAEKKAHRGDILKAVKDREIMGHEKNPMKSLANYLSGFDELKPVGGDGFWGRADAP